MLKKLPQKICHQFPAFKYRNYRLYFLGQLVSFTGSWLQGVAHGWLVYELTKSPFWLGAVSAVSALPVLILSLFGGLLVDRFDRKRLLYFTQTSALVLALVLGILTLTRLINAPLLLLLTLLSGVANAIDNPVTQAFVVDIVGKDDLPSAVGLNSTMFNTGRVLGPAVAGYLIALVGIGNIFLINAASFLAILVSLYFIRTNIAITKPKRENPLRAIREGIFYSYSHPLISLLLLTAGVGAIFCFSQGTIMPILVREVFRQGTQGFGNLLSATGLGALVGSLIISSKAKRVRSIHFIAAGNVLFLVSTLLFTYTTDLKFAALCLFFSGLGLTMEFSTVYASVQRLVKEEYRGRVSSIYVLLFVGFSPIGNMLIGGSTSWLGPLTTIRITLAVTFIFGMFMFLKLPKARKNYCRYAQIPYTPSGIHPSWGVGKIRIILPIPERIKRLSPSVLLEKI